MLQQEATALRDRAGKSRGVPVEEVTPLSPITRPARIVCQGVNYAKHRTEAGLPSQKPPVNTFFTKADSTLTGARDAIARPPEVELLDYEIELGLVLRADITGPITVTTDTLPEVVGGLFIANDVSARDIQIPPGQWFLGKSYRTFCPTGPILCLLEDGEGPLVHHLALNLWVNGELRQSASTAQLLYTPEETLTELSRVMDLQAGDVLLTGTPGGVH
nr:fumarylacetoacetate hydrolase family protein [Sulfobacillus harzensis]